MVDMTTIVLFEELECFFNDLTGKKFNSKIELDWILHYNILLKQKKHKKYNNSLIGLENEIHRLTQQYKQITQVNDQPSFSTFKDIRKLMGR